MKATLDGSLEWLGGMAFRATSETGHEIVVDADPAVGGAGRGPLPIELVLLGLGGCTGMDVVSILRKMRQDVTAYQVRLHADRAEEHPRVFTAITVEHVVRGRNLNPDMVRRAVELSATRYCPASAMLKKAAPIEERFRVIDDATGAEVAAGPALQAA